MALNGRMTSKWWIGIDVEERIRDLAEKASLKYKPTVLPPPTNLFANSICFKFYFLLGVTKNAESEA
jgi:hypothetical protein